MALTELERTEEDARRASERLFDVSRLAAMGEMATGIAHELNQPLTAIANYARACERLLSLPRPDLDEALDAVREIGREALRAGDVIRRLRTLVRNEIRERAPTAINDVVEELRLLTQAEARANCTRVAFELDENLPTILVDRVQLTQALLNLFRNALESLGATPVGNRQVTVFTRRTPYGDVEVDVCDNGLGVDPGIRDRLFDPFSTTKPHGTGLGLAMSRTIVRAHGGTVTYVPLEPHGACFRVTLSAVQSDDA